MKENTLQGNWHLELYNLEDSSTNYDFYKIIRNETPLYILT